MSPTVSALMVSLQSLVLLLQKIRHKHQASNQVTTMLGTVMQVSTKFVLPSCNCLQPLAFINSTHPEADESVSTTSFLSYTSWKNLFHHHEWLPAIYCQPSFPPHPTLLASTKLYLSSLNFLTCHLYHKLHYALYKYEKRHSVLQPMLPFSQLTCCYNYSCHLQEDNLLVPCSVLTLFLSPFSIFSSQVHWAKTVEIMQLLFPPPFLLSLLCHPCPGRHAMWTCYLPFLPLFFPCLSACAWSITKLKHRLFCNSTGKNVTFWISHCFLPILRTQKGNTASNLPAFRFPVVCSNLSFLLFGD